jgi:hypothetical protein
MGASPRGVWVGEGTEDPGILKAKVTAVGGLCGVIGRRRSPRRTSKPPPGARDSTGRVPCVRVSAVQCFQERHHDLVAHAQVGPPEGEFDRPEPRTGRGRGQAGAGRHRARRIRRTRCRVRPRRRSRPADRVRRRWPGGGPAGGVAAGRGAALREGDAVDARRRLRLHGDLAGLRAHWTTGRRTRSVRACWTPAGPCSTASSAGVRRPSPPGPADRPAATRSRRTGPPRR